MTTFDDIVKQAQRPETSVALCLLGNLVAEYRELERKLQTASRVADSLGERSEASVIAERMRDLETQMSDSTVTFRLQAMKARAWSDFKDTRPVKLDDETEQQLNDRFFDWVCQLVSRCCVDPEMTPDQVAELVDHLSGAQWDELSNAAWRLNAQGVAVPFSVAASALIPRDERK